MVKKPCLWKVTIGVKIMQSKNFTAHSSLLLARQRQEVPCTVSHKIQAKISGIRCWPGLFVLSKYETLNIAINNMRYVYSFKRFKHS
mgnify:CR=1